MDKERIKKGYEVAKQELQEEEINRVKEVIKATLRKMEDLKQQKRKLEKQIKILRLDIEDFKSGRLDRIEERQKVDKEAKEVSVVVIEKEVVKEPCYPWLVPYVISVKEPYYVPSTIYYSDSTSDYSSFSVTGTTAKNYTIGSYNIGGEIINLR